MSILFEPAKIGNIGVKNRFIRSATNFSLSDEDGFVSEPNIDLIKTLAENEVGLVVTGNCHILKNGQGMVNCNSIESDDYIPGFQKMTRAVHDVEGKVVMQIGHVGVQSRIAADKGRDYITVSMFDNMPDFGRKPRVMNEEDIENIIHAFGQAARRAQEAELDGIQILGAHGYLVSQFLSRRTNKRTDKWGGSLENRARFVVEVTRTIKQQVGNDFPVMIKFGCKEYREDEEAFSVEEAAWVSKKLEDEGICLIEISHHGVTPSFRKAFDDITSPEKEAPLLPDARILRKSITVPIALVMGMRSLPVMEEIIRSGDADFIALCRPLIREPGLIKRWKDGDTRPADCISCTSTDYLSQSRPGCFNVDENGKLCIYCRQLKKLENRTG